MILSKLQKFAGAILVLALTTGTLSAQQGLGRNAALNGQNSVCLDRISGLTAKQSDKIRELDNKHQEEMAQLREERRSATDFNKKDEIRNEMLKKVENHRSEVRSLLNERQQEEFDSLPRFGNRNAPRGNGFARGNSNCIFGQGNRGNGSCGRNLNGRGKNRGQMQGNFRNQNFQYRFRGGFNSSNS